MGFRKGKIWECQTGQHQSPALARVYEQLADIYLQLRGLEFADIGALGMPTGTVEDITIRHRPLPIEVLLQHVEGLNSTSFFPEKQTFKTAHSYVSALVNLASNQLRETRDPEFTTTEDARDVLFAYYHLCRYVAMSWTRKQGNVGPFVLMHGDLSLHGGNLIWDDNLNLRAVIDWEWSHTIPIQCFIPPVWLLGFYPKPVRYISFHGMRAYQNELRTFCKYISERSINYPPSSYSREWQNMSKSSDYLVVLALLYPATINDIYWNFLNSKLYPVQYESPDSIKRYREECDGRDFLLNRSLRELCCRESSLSMSTLTPNTKNI